MTSELWLTLAVVVGLALVALVAFGLLALYLDSVNRHWPVGGSDD